MKADHDHDYEKSHFLKADYDSDKRRFRYR